MLKSTDSLFHPQPEHIDLRKMLVKFVRQEVEPQALEFDKKEEFNIKLFKKLGEQGLLGLLIPEEFGGSGMDVTASLIVHEELSFSDPGLCLAYLAHSILCVHNIYRNGSPEQCKMLLPKLASGEWIGAMAMSEADSGTDVLSMRTHAKKSSDHYLLNGRKMWITNGSVDENKTPCDCLLVYAKVQDKISSFIVKKDFEGFYVGQKIQDKLGMRASNTSELVFDNCKVPTDFLLGEEGGALKHMLRNLEIERLTLAAMALGVAKRSLEEMNKYASERQAFGKPIRAFGQIQKHLAQSYAEFQAVRSYVYNVARQLDLGKAQQRLQSDGAKLIATRVAKDLADRAIQVLGGYGYVGEYQVERLWRDAKLLEIGGGTSEALEKNIAKDLDGVTEV